MSVKSDNLKVRAQVLRTIRAFFDARGFVEVETPVRIAAPAPEPHIDCPASGDGFLRASPELQMKKLLAAGLPRIYQIGPCFREGERGRRHAPEFTMLEWYRAEADYNDIAADMEALVDEVLRTRGSASLPEGTRRSRSSDDSCHTVSQCPLTDHGQRKRAHSFPVSC